MIVDNGQRVPLIIAGVFEGVCGVSRGVLAFTPNRNVKNPLAARGALLDGEPIALVEVNMAEDGRSYLARYQVLA